MFQKAISKYGLAVHLALLTALPVVFSPFLPAEALTRLVLWLSLFSGIWIFMEPSIRPGEHLSTARGRVCAAVVRDPVFYFFVVAVMFAAIRWWNSDLALAYDAERSVWAVEGPAAPILPASVPGAGMLPFAYAVAAGVLAMGLRHAVGAGARVSYALTTVTCLGMGGFACAIQACRGETSFVEQALVGFEPSRLPATGFLYGMGLLLAVTAGVQAEVRGWARGRWAFSLAVGGCAAGLIFYAPPLVTASYVAVAVLLAVFALVWLMREGSGGAVTRSLVFLAIGFGLSMMLTYTFAPERVKTVKIAAFDPGKAWSEDTRETNRVLARISRAIWLKHPWCGAGLGAFPLQLPFEADKDDWEVLSTRPERPLNGYWHVLCERGNVGCGLLAVGLGLLLWFWGARLAEAATRSRSDSESEVFAFACPPVVWAPLPVLMLVGVEAVFAPVFAVNAVFPVITGILTLAASSFPRRHPVATQKENS